MNDKEGNEEIHGSASGFVCLTVYLFLFYALWNKKVVPPDKLPYLSIENLQIRNGNLKSK